MKNFIKRLLASIVLGSLFILFIILGGSYFYLALLIIFLSGVAELIKINDLKVKILIFVLLIIFLFSFLELRIQTNGLFLVLWCIFITWLTDTAAFIFGKLFGKKKIGIISPNKTYFGFISGIIFSQSSYFFTIIFIKNINYINLKTILLIQFIVSLSVIMGDLFFSYLKRKINIKDFSNIIPGHGGIFDRIDGLIFSIIFFYIIF